MIPSCIDCDHSYSFTSDDVLHADNEEIDVDSTEDTQAYSHLPSALHDHFSYTVIHDAEFEDSVEDVTTENFVTPLTYKCAIDFINTTNVTPKIVPTKNMSLQNNDSSTRPSVQNLTIPIYVLVLKGGQDVLL